MGHRRGACGYLGAAAVLEGLWGSGWWGWVLWWARLCLHLNIRISGYLWHVSVEGLAGAEQPIAAHMAGDVVALAAAGNAPPKII